MIEIFSIAAISSFAALSLLLVLYHAKASDQLAIELKRKTLHILLCGLAIAFYFQSPRLESFLLYAVISLIFLVCIRRAPREIRNRILYRNQQGSWGEFFLWGGLLVTGGIFWNQPTYFLVTVLIVGLSDGAAAIVGLVCGTYILVEDDYDRKTLEGSLTFFVSTLLILTFYKPIPIEFSATLSIVLTTFEIVSLRGVDNLVIPLAAVLLLSVAATSAFSIFISVSVLSLCFAPLILNYSRMRVGHARLRVTRYDH